MKNFFLIPIIGIAFIFGCSQNEITNTETDKVSENQSKVIDKSIRVIWIKPTDVAYSASTVNAISNAMRTVQHWYKENLDGYELRLNSPLVEVINGDHDRNWYNEHRPADYGFAAPTFYTIENVREEVKRKTGITDYDPRYKTIIYINAEGGGAANYGMAFLGQNDVDGLLGKYRNDSDRQAGMKRWWQGLAHELGHTFGFPDYDNDTSIMGRVGFFKFPNSNLTPSEKKTIIESGFVYRSPLPFSSNRFYKIKNVSTNLVVDVLNAATGDNFPIGQWNDQNSDNQLFKITRVGSGIYKIINQRSGRGWNISEASKDNGGKLIQYGFGDFENERFAIVAHRNRYMFFPIHSLKAIAPDPDPAKVELSQITSTGRNIQLWTIN
jgi:predicted Zn-dependent protease